MFDKREECPICGHPKFQNFHICTDHTVSGESFALVQCANCTHVFTNPKPTEERLGDYYQSVDYISHSNAISNPVDILYKLVRHYTIRQKHKLIRSLGDKEGSLLDFGCGTGHFLHYSAKQGWSARGVEPNKEARQLAKAQDTYTVEETLSLVKGHFDIITAWHVIEHLPDPVSSLRELRQKLNDEGHIVLALPNHKSFDAKHYGKDWAGYDVPRHLSHFNKASVKVLAEKSKLKITRIVPMYFDAYYVSILSEKYQGHAGALMKGMRIGKKSNASAKLTGEYSSLIYILSK